MDQIKIGKFISELRKEKNLTQEQLGEKLGITKNAVSKWERGLSLMDIALLEPLSEIFGVSIDEILNGERIESTSNTNIYSVSITSTQGIFIYFCSIVWIFLLGLTRLQGIAAHCIWISLIFIFCLIGIESISKNVKYYQYIKPFLFFFFIIVLSFRLSSYLQLFLFSTGDLLFLLISCFGIISICFKYLKHTSSANTILSTLFFINGLITLSVSYSVSPMPLVHTSLIIIGSTMYAVGLYFSNNKYNGLNNAFIKSLLIYYIIRFLLDNGLYSLQLIILETMTFTLLFILTKANKTNIIIIYSVPLYLTMFRLIFGSLNDPIYLFPTLSLYFVIISIPIVFIYKTNLCHQ